MEFLDELTEGLDRVLMVRGGGREVITFYLWGHLSLLWFEKGHHLRNCFRRLSGCNLVHFEKQF